MYTNGVYNKDIPPVFPDTGLHLFACPVKTMDTIL